MADTNENSGENSGKQMTDIAFMAECFKHLNGPFNVDLAAVAEGLGYKNHNSVGNRLRAIKKKWGIGAADGAEAGADGATPAAPKTPRKGPKAARGPLKAKAEGDEEEAKPSGSPAKRGRKPAANGGGRKRKTAAASNEKENVDPKEDEAEVPKTEPKTEPKAEDEGVSKDATDENVA
ncbi:uncharacterized protein GIQ15_06795 [Arthroderma uncinatum]|uniref:uncharacterized protein n=1 Tax=Arthroderma uncinatum TaxID=74035 RepID=UPI00144A6562|nr:uncharacterized protein GIQ15_06795 [Arthroderma uncinatum]KAF3479819.1 hypothetical protein GIQ15_06795 [Arthroderma uncinatum]